MAPFGPACRRSPRVLSTGNSDGVPLCVPRQMGEIAEDRVPPTPVTLLRHPIPGNLPYGSFAFVMATGIVSIATRLNGLAWLSGALFALNLSAFALLWLLLINRVGRRPAAVLDDLAEDREAPAILTVVAGTCVIASEIALTGAFPVLVAALWMLAAALWLGFVYGIAVGMTIRPAKAPIVQQIDGSWLLAVVATQALAILTTHLAGTMLPREPALFVSLCLFLLGGVLYIVLIVLIVQRWLSLPMRPEDLTPPYWINMGAAAITTLTGALLVEALGPDAVRASVRDFVAGATILSWSVASGWIPLLTDLTVWRHRRGVPVRYRLDNWAMVFPLGMYTTATWRFAHGLGFRFLDIVPNLFVWIALAAWCLNFIGLLHALARSPSKSPARD